MQYPAKIVPDGDGWMVSFRDIPEALTSGPTYEKANEQASGALLDAMDFYVEDRRRVPDPSQPRRGEVLIALPASAAAKVLLLNQMVEQGVRPAQLARNLDTTPQVVNRLVDLHHATKIDTVEAALASLGKRLELRAV